MEEGGRKGDRESGSHAKSHATSHMPTMLTRAHGKVERGFEVKQVGQEAGPDNKGRREGKGRGGGRGSGGQAAIGILPRSG